MPWGWFVASSSDHGGHTPAPSYPHSRARELLPSGSFTDRNLTVDFFGVYRGVVMDNLDPLSLGRVQISVPAVRADTLWAMPCVPFGSATLNDTGLPPVGADIWVMFEGGNSDLPVVLGSFPTTP
jgi:hypothetical protein